MCMLFSVFRALNHAINRHCKNTHRNALHMHHGQEVGGDKTIDDARMADFILYVCALISVIPSLLLLAQLASWITLIACRLMSSLVLKMTQLHASSVCTLSVSTETNNSTFLCIVRGEKSNLILA